MLRRLNVLWGLVAVLAAPTVQAEGIRIEGRVLVTSGAPLPQAEVSLRPLQDALSAAARRSAEPVPEPEPPAARAVTNSEGHFQLQAPHAGLWVVRVAARGFVPLESNLQPLIEPIVLPEARLEADAGVRIEVRDARGPVTGARVIARGDRSRLDFFRGVWSPPEREGYTDAAGRLVLPKGDRERLTVTASAPGRVLAERSGVGALAKLVLAAGVERPLLVLGTDGQPLRGAVVALGPQVHPYGQASDSGSLHVAVAPTGQTRLEVGTADGRRLVTTLDAGTEEARRKPLLLSVPDMAALPGKLIDADSRRPIEGGLVWDSDEPGQAATSDSSGGFVLWGPAGARLQLTAGAPGYLNGARLEVQLGDDGRAGPTLALEPAAAVEGQVVDAEGQGVAGAEVTIATRQAPGMMRIQIGAPTTKPRNLSDENGRFRIGALDPDERYALEVAAEGFAPAEQSLIGLEPYRTKTGVRVTLTPGQAVIGRVIDGAGKPVREVSVALTPAQERGSMGMMRMMQPASERVFEGMTDADGRFRVPGVPGGRFDLEAHRQGFAKTRVAGLEVAGAGDPSDAGEITLVPGVRVSGLVTDRAGKPIEGAEVRAQEAGPAMTMMMGHGPGPEQEADALTDPGGWFVIEDRAPGEKLTLAVHRTGYIDASAKGVELPHVDPVEIVLAPGSTVSGVVLTEDGEPIQAAQVELSRRESVELGGNVMMMMMLESATSDADGRFSFTEQQPGQIGLTAVASGHQERKLDNVEVPEGQDLEGIELTLPAGAIVVGRVFGPDGRPLIGARVSRVGGGESSPMRMTEGSPTDGDGRYRLEGQAPGAVSVEANHADWPRTVKDLELDPGLNTLDLRFEGGQPVSGLVVDATGGAVPDADVRLAAAGRFWGGPETRTRADGTFEIPGVADGEYQLWAVAEGYASSANRTVEVAGGPVAGIEVRLDAGATVSGRVLGLDSDAYSQVTVRADGPGTSGFGGAPTDRQGNYRLEHLRAGTYEVVAALADSGRSATGRLTIEEGQTEAILDLRFQPGLELTGFVREGEAPVVGASVFVEGTSLDRTGWSDTDQQGRFSIEGLEPGSYRVNVREWGSGLAYDEPLELATSREITIEIPTAFVAGEVRDATDRSPLAGVTLTLVPEDPTRQGRLPLHTVASDLEGRFKISSVGGGSWRLTANKDGYAAATRTLAIQFDRPTDDVDLAMDATEGLELAALLPSGQAPAELQIAVLDPSGGTLVTGTFPTGEGGRVRLSSVPPGTWDVIIGAVGAAVTTVRATAPGPAVPVVLKPSTRLRVSVSELDEPGTRAFVRLADASGQPFRSLSWSGRPTSEWAMSGGEVELATLPPGNWKVTVGTADGRQWTGESATSSGQVAELRLE